MDIEKHIPPTPPIGELVASLVAQGRITVDDALTLRRAVFRDGGIAEAEAERLFALDEAISDKAPEWTALFLEALTDYLVRQAEPRGYVSDANAAWLVAMISRDGLVKSASELELLLHVIETASRSPESLELFALAQVKAAVLLGNGPLADGGTLTPGVIGPDEVALVRRVLYAHGGTEGIGISRAEADMLFDLNDASSEAENCNEWSDLFVKAISNHLMTAAGLRMPSREDILARDGWLDDEQHLDMFTMFDSDLVRDALVDSLRRLKSTVCCNNKPEGADDDADAMVAAPIDDDEARWLIGRIRHDGAMHDNELALLLFLKEENPDINPLFEPLFEEID